jgi:hypothetical protein
LAFLFPNRYSKIISQINSTVTSLVFYTVNFSLGVLALIIWRYIQTKDGSVFFQTISEMIIVLPVAILGLIFFSLILYILAVIFGGRAGFVQSLSVVGFSSVPIIFIFIPNWNLLAFSFWIYLLILSFKNIHKYKQRLAFINIVFPFLIVFIFMIVVGLFNFSSIISRIQNFT